MQKYAVVVGGVNMDICGTSATAILGGDSNPGAVETASGGVGRNIAENISRLGCKTYMVTVLGDDAYGHQLKNTCEILNIDMSQSAILKGERTGTYLCLNNPDGDVYAAVSDMGIYERLTPAFLAERLQFLNEAQFVVVDANISEEAIHWLVDHCTAPIVADPVSVKKSQRIRSALPKLAMIKPNRPEASQLTGIEIRDMAGVEKAAAALHEMGTKNVFISLGGDGVYYSDGKISGVQPTFPGTIINTNGCGDTFLAAAAIAMVNGEPIDRMAALGQAAASLTAASFTTASPKLSMPLIRRMVGQ